MAEKKLTTIVAACNPDGDVDSVRQLTEAALSAGADGIVMLGNLTPANSSPQQYGAILKILGDTHLWIFYVPGSQDAPFHEFLRQAANFEIVFPRLRCVHSTFALANGPILFSGMGGAVDDDPSGVRDETTTLRYPGWEVEYRLKFLHDLKDYPKVLLFTSAPEHKGLHIEGSSVLAEVVKTHNPQFVIIGGEEPKQGIIGAKSHIVAPGSLGTGHYALVNLRKHEVAPGVLRQVRAA
jgi:hypothetical protein